MVEAVEEEQAVVEEVEAMEEVEEEAEGVVEEEEAEAEEDSLVEEMLWLGVSLPHLICLAIKHCWDQLLAPLFQSIAT